MTVALTTPPMSSTESAGALLIDSFQSDAVTSRKKTGFGHRAKPRKLNRQSLGQLDEDFFGELDESGEPVDLDDSLQLPMSSLRTAANYQTTKRLLDIAGSIVGLILLAVPTLAALLIVWLWDRKNPIFAQTRVGLNGEPFTMFKVRSMYRDAEEKFEEIQQQNKHDDHRTFKMDSDPRVIPVVGTFIRKFSIDEFPQLWNVLRGDMSLVGPRPALPREVRHYSVDDIQRLVVKPGLTCTWQVSGRGNLAFREQLILDLQYIDQCSLKTDLSLIARTVPALLTSNGAR